MKHAPILDAHRQPPPWHIMTHEQQAAHYHKVKRWYVPGIDEDPFSDVPDDHPDIEEVYSILALHMPPALRDRLGGDL
jgi:hypothetical protein